MQLPGRFKPPELDQEQRAVLHDPARERLPAAHCGVRGAAAVRHPRRGEAVKGLNVPEKGPNTGLSSLACLTRDSCWSTPSQIEIAQTFVPYVWIVLVSFTSIFLSNRVTFF